MWSVPGNRSKVAWAVLCGAVLLFGCGPKEKFPAEPRIEYKSFEQLNDTATVTISFTDGDGDIGVDDSWPHEPGSLYYNNLLVFYEVLQQGVWEDPGLGIELHARIPPITPTGQNKVLQGDIAYGLGRLNIANSGWPVQAKPPGTPNDTVRFRLRLVDRALNESNEVATESIVVTY